MKNRVHEAVKPDDMPAGGSVGEIGADPALDVQDDALFADIATHDDYAEPVAEEPSTEGAPSANTDGESGTPTPAAAADPQPTPPPTVAVTPTPPAVQAGGAPSPTEQPTPASAAAPDSAPATEQQPEPVDFEKHRETVLPKLEELYKLTDEEAEAVRVAPETALPKLAARLHFEATTAAFNSVVAVLPNIIENVTKQQKLIQEQEEKFYSRWGALKDPKYEQTVLNSVRAYRTANPRASAQETIEHAGLMAMLALGLNPNPAPQQQAQPTPTPAMRPAVPAGAGVPSSPFAGSSNGPMDDIQALIAAEMAGQL